ncbi:tectonin beta-propeller repeat-containing protein 1 [Gracilinanus agilis]|uniref:tectonin beta-propeller repeat-containing protein 1 n=1 Tax=Gracilinanus agilis TaxID=191870 RepID=UPI001CFF0F3C|nr:tectonin beta-propeller repeat-containing protein 1 [Gracilinanus agilis]
MPNSLLWAVDIFGRVYTLATAGQYWELCKDAHLEFKRVSAVKQCCWGIACDNQVYVYVCSSDVPIRHREETYENQRWNPVGGFCEKLMPSDRWQWSDVSGLKHQQLDSLVLPSPHWEWESDWYVDENFGGEPTEKGGWTYAMDFPATYTRDKKWNSCVRRRKWIRYRRYKSRDTWAKVSFAGCFFGDEVRGSGDSLGPSDTDTSSEAERPGLLPEDESCLGRGRLRGEEEAALSVNREGKAQGTAPAELPWTNIDLKETRKTCAHSASCFAETSSLSSLGLFPMGLEEGYGADDHPLWAWVSGGGCTVDTHTVLKWFTIQSGLSASMQTLSLSITPAQTAAWRKQIFQQLTERTKRELENFRHYEQAVEQSVWVKTGTLQWWVDWKPHKWIDVRVALEQFTGNDGTRDSILFIYYMFHEEKKYIHIFLNEVTVLVPVLNEAKHSFALYTPEKTKQRWPIRLAAATEQEMYDWLALLSTSCSESRRIQGRPSPQAIWSVTCKGDIFVSEPSVDLEAPGHPMPCDQMFWRQIGGHLRVVECNSHGVVWGIGYDHTAWVYTGGYGGGFFQGLASSTSNIYMQSDVKCVYIYENQRWNPVTGYTSRGLPTDRYMWSDVTGLQECTKANTKPPSLHWTWVSDWYIDFNISGGTDREGWQYASDFPSSYHGYKTMKDFVRRRRWARKCKLVTSGPWLEVAPISLWDVSIIPGYEEGSKDSIALWAISDKGDVLCRLGVSELNPAGSSWLHVGTDQPFISVSVGAFYQVWAVARDGSAFYRGSVSPKQPAGKCCSSPSRAREQLANVLYLLTYHAVWVIANKVQGSHSLSCGTVCHRTGVQPREPKGQGWDYGIGGGWDHVSVRANATKALKGVSQETAEDNPSRTADPEEGDESRESSFSNKTMLVVHAGHEANGSAVTC